MFDQPHNHSNSITKSSQFKTSKINSFGNIGPFYSIRLKEYNKLFNCHLSNLHKARALSVILVHLSNYTRCLQTSMSNTYGLSWPLIKKVLTELLALGLIKEYPVKRKTNIGVYVPLFGYSITVDGKDKAKQLSELLESKVALLKK